MSSNAPQPRIRMEPGFEQTWPSADALATECLLNLGFVAALMGRLGEALMRRHGFPSLAAFDALATIEREGRPLPPSTIAERMIVSRPTITGVIRSLERRRLVKRLAHPTDHRMALLKITPEGRALVRRVRLVLHQGERQWMSTLTREEQRALLGVLARLQANAPRP